MSCEGVLITLFLRRLHSDPSQGHLRLEISGEHTRSRLPLATFAFQEESTSDGHEFTIENRTGLDDQNQIPYIQEVVPPRLLPPPLLFPEEYVEFWAELLPLLLSHQRYALVDHVSGVIPLCDLISVWEDFRARTGVVVDPAQVARRIALIQSVERRRT